MKDCKASCLFLICILVGPIGHADWSNRSEWNGCAHWFNTSSGLYFHGVYATPAPNMITHENADGSVTVFQRSGSFVIDRGAVTCNKPGKRSVDSAIADLLINNIKELDKNAKSAPGQDSPEARALAQVTYEEHAKAIASAIKDCSDSPEVKKALGPYVTTEGVPRAAPFGAAAK